MQVARNASNLVALGLAYVVRFGLGLLRAAMSQTWLSTPGGTHVRMCSRRRERICRAEVRDHSSRVAGSSGIVLRFVGEHGDLCSHTVGNGQTWLLLSHFDQHLVQRDARGFLESGLRHVRRGRLGLLVAALLLVLDRLEHRPGLVAALFHNFQRAVGVRSKRPLRDVLGRTLRKAPKHFAGANLQLVTNLGNGWPERRRRIRNRFSLIAACTATSPSLSSSTSSAPSPTGPMSFFITSAGIGKGADLGGIAGVDAQCQRLARAAGAGNRTWPAYLSTPNLAAIARTRPCPPCTPANASAKGRGSTPWARRSHATSINCTAATASAMKRRWTSAAMRYRSSTALRACEQDILTGSRDDGRSFSQQMDTTCRDWTHGGADGSAIPRAP